ncbi:hypothetical protein BX070DRAFT_85916 [Coemansia spiralis]|nr:hypothetical protein BX070DRAFT_85916 [Coemansia spiralis]
MTLQLVGKSWQCTVQVQFCSFEGLLYILFFSVLLVLSKGLVEAAHKGPRKGGEPERCALSRRGEVARRYSAKVAQPHTPWLIISASGKPFVPLLFSMAAIGAFVVPFPCCCAREACTPRIGRQLRSRDTGRPTLTLVFKNLPSSTSSQDIEYALNQSIVDQWLLNSSGSPIIHTLTSLTSRYWTHIVFKWH